MDIGETARQMEGKKISFGFKKTKKLEKPVEEEKKDFIECVEEQSIKVVGGDNVEEAAPLVIAMKPNTLMTTERLKQIAEEVEGAVLEPEVKEEPKSPRVKEEVMDETIEQMAVRELLQEANKKEVKVEGPGLVLLVPAQPKLEGQKESTLDDYESVPIQEFGLAMLRGMGWAPGKEKTLLKQPQLRPKGLGLGADTVLKQNQKKAVDKDGKELVIMKNAFVKVNVGKYKGYYGKVVSLDEDNGRVMVDMPLRKQTISLGEFMMTPVTKSEFDSQSRVINADKYEEYKKKEQTGTGHKSTRHDSPKMSERESSSRSDDVSNRDRERRGERSNRDREERSNRDREERSNRDREPDRNRERDHERPSVRSREPDSSNGRNKERETRRRDSSSSEDRSKQRKRDKKRYSSQESLSSESETDRKKHKKDKTRKSSTDSDSDDYKKQKKSKKHRRSESPKEKRDIDKKRKGKKKKRDRDRSPNYKKHRK